MSESKTALKSSGKSKTQADKLCPKCNKAIIPIMKMPGRRIVWRHKWDTFIEGCPE